MESCLQTPVFLSECSFEDETNESLHASDTDKSKEFTVPYPVSDDSSFGSSSPSLTTSLPPSSSSGSSNISNCDLSNNACYNYNFYFGVLKNEYAGFIVKQISQSSDNQRKLSCSYDTTPKTTKPSMSPDPLNQNV